MTNLQPCPFCGQHHLWTYRSTYAPDDQRFVKCAIDPQEDDGCVSGVNVNLWNTRPIEDALRAENQRLREAGDAMFEVLTRAEHALEIAESDFMEIQEVCQDIDMTQQDWACLTALAGEEVQP